MGRELHGKNIEGTTHGKAEGNREPAFLAKAENKEEKSPDSEESSQGRGVAVKDFRNQIWSSNEEAEGNKGYDHFLGSKILHRLQCKVEKVVVKRESFVWGNANNLRWECLDV